MTWAPDPWHCCAHPELWRNVSDGNEAEEELYPWLTALVILCKARTIVETGAYRGRGTVALAQGCRANGFGSVISYETSEEHWRRANECIAHAGLSDVAQVRYGSSLEVTLPVNIDLLFCDGGDRTEELRRLVPYLSESGIVVAHDAADETRFRWNDIGAPASRILLPTPRGIWLLQRPL